MLDILKTIYDASEDKKGKNIRVLDISNLTIVADYFVLVSGTNYNQVQAIVDEIQDKVFETEKIHPLRVEGQAKGGWILVDFGNVVVHVFDEENRHFYDLDRIWSDAVQIA